VERGDIKVTLSTTILECRGPRDVFNSIQVLFLPGLQSLAKELKTSIPWANGRVRVPYFDCEVSESLLCKSPRLKNCMYKLFGDTLFAV
jgi:hypothetical protein